MRKYILDGSLSSGFQRTGILGVDGYVYVDNIKINLPVINLEEDSCKLKNNFWLIS